MRVFLKSSVLIRAVERPGSHAAVLVDQVLAREIEAAVDDIVLDEVARFFGELRTPAFARLYVDQLRRVAHVVTQAEAEPFFDGTDPTLSLADRAHHAAALAAGAEEVVAEDEDRRAAPPKGLAAYYTRRDLLRCVIIALIVGTLLVGINVRPGPTPGDPPDFARIVVNYLVPFTVASVSALLANRARILGAHQVH